jgi:hypothetical protein
VQVFSQHTPSTQWPLEHSESALHANPSAQFPLGWQASEMQLGARHCAFAAQSELVTQLVVQVVAVAQAYQPQLDKVETQLPALSHCLSVTSEPAQLEPQSVPAAIVRQAPAPSQLAKMQGPAVQVPFGLVPKSALTQAPARVAP